MFDFLNKLFGGDMPKIDATSYEAEYFGKNNHVLIDVRTTGEFKAGHLPKAKNIPLNELTKELNQIPKDKPVIIVCQSGSRSASATRSLMNAGYENVINLQGGTMRWMMMGKPISK